MEYVKFGNTGLDVSRICLGCMSFGEVVPGWHSWVLDEEKSRSIIRRALDLGINFFDTANVYAGGRVNRSRDGFSRSLRIEMKSCSPRKCGDVCIQVRMERGYPGKQY